MMIFFRFSRSLAGEALKQNISKQIGRVERKIYTDELKYLGFFLIKK
jgi:hypothetical protein